MKFRFKGRSSRLLCRPLRLEANALESRVVPTALIALTTSNSLVRFDSDAPSTITSTTPITGLVAGDTLVGIDYRPANGQLLGLSTNRIYLIDPTTGVATAKNATPFAPALTGTNFGFDFNPAVDKLRLVSESGQNLRVNADTGAVLFTDTPLAYDAATYEAAVGGKAPAPQIVGAAYTNTRSLTDTTVTTLYVIDANTNLLSTQGGPGDDVPAISPNGGQLFVIDKLAFDVLPNSGFDIETGTDVALVNSGAKLYSVNLATGGSSSLGTIGSGITIQDISIVAPATGASTLQFSASTAVFPAERGPVALTVTRTGGTADAATVNYATADGTATAGTDYLPQNGTLTFGVGETTQTIFLQVPATTPAPSAATNFTVTLSAPTGTATLGSTSTVTVTIPAVTATPSGRTYAVGTGPGIASLVRVYDQVSGAELFNFAPYEPAFTGGVNVATGDVNGDGFDDLVIGTGNGGGPRVVVFDGATRAVLADFFTYEPEFRGGVNVTVADVNGDGFGDILNGSGNGGGPRVRVLDGDELTNSKAEVVIADYFAFENTFRGGVNVSGGDVNGDGFADVLAGAGVGGGPRVTLFDGKTIGTAGSEPPSIQNFFAYDSATRSGVQISIGDVTGDGRAEILTGTGPGGGPNVRAFDGTSLEQIQNFFAYDSSLRGGVSVTAKDLDGDGANDIITGSGPGSQPVVKVFRNATEVSSFSAFDSTFLGGVTVG